MNQLLNQKEFLLKYNIKRDELDKCPTQWETLEAIYQDYCKARTVFLDIIDMVYKMLMRFEKVHSVRSRVKDPEHLIEKIIRRGIEATVEDYQHKVKDLMGMRVIHLFKNDWEAIHDFLIETFDICEKEAKIREGDSDELQKKFKDKGLKVSVHKYGYRSIHYALNVSHVRHTYLVELQVRTIFEEGWSEIDHQVRYPYDQDHPIYKEVLMILNRLAGSADEMGSFIESLQDQQIAIKIEAAQKDQQINELKESLNKLNVSKDQKPDLQAIISQVSKMNEWVQSANSLKNISEAVERMKSGVSNMQDLKFHKELAEQVKKINNR